MPPRSTPRLFRRSDCASWHYGFRVAGRRVRGCTGEADRGAAERRLAAIWAAAHARSGVQPAQRAELDLTQVAALWLAQAEERASEKNPRYVERHEQDIRHLLRVFREPGEITTDAWARACRAWRAQGMSPRSLQHLTTTARHVLRHARAVGALDGDPPSLEAPSGRAVAKAARRRRALSREERDALLESMRKNGDLRAARIWTVLAYTGLRRGEAARLAPDWCSSGGPAGSERTLTIPAGAAKSGEEEQIPLHPAAWAAIEEEMRELPRGDSRQPVFGGFDLRKAFARACAAAGIDRRGLTAHHAARHTFGTLLAEVSRGDVSAVLAGGRWRSLSIAQRYVHASAERARVAVRRL